MFLSKLFINIVLLFTLCMNSHILYADPIPITDIDEVVSHVRMLRASGVKADDIGIILDCHGVIVNEIPGEEKDSASYTLKGKIQEALQYFIKEEKISVGIATAWRHFDDVVEHAILGLGLQDYFKVTPGKNTELEDFSVGLDRDVKLKGHQNGNVVALKYANSSKRETYFRQKAFALEVIYPKQRFTHIIGVDYSKHNLMRFEQDFPRTRLSSEGCNFTLFRIRSPEEITVSQLPAPYKSVVCVRGPGERGPIPYLPSSQSSNQGIPSSQPAAPSDPSDVPVLLSLRPDTPEYLFDFEMDE